MAALIQRVAGFVPANDEKLLARAAALAPALHTRQAAPQSSAFLPQSGPARDLPPAALPAQPLRPGEGVQLDFGAHLVGHVTLRLASTGSHPDAPALIRLRLAERPAELDRRREDYHGWVSGGWIQEELIHLDELPAVLALPRRYAFRYCRLTVLETSPKYALTLCGAVCTAQTAADLSRPEPLASGDALLDRIDAVSLRTLAECMQDVFEDGPKRDRRLWLGDLRLQALTNAVSFQNYGLVKRCLYLFAGSRFPDGRVSACVFTRPAPAADDTWLFDYALLFTVTLEEYLQSTGDAEALADLYPVAMEQLDLSLALCTDDLAGPQAAENTFIDWTPDLDKAACAQAVLLCALAAGTRLAQRKGDAARAAALAGAAQRCRAAARRRYWDEARQCAVSNGQCSPASQVWLVLAGVLSTEESRAALAQVPVFAAEYPMTTPYMHHYYVAALRKAGLAEQALAHIRQYWGGMLAAGADTFWEAWDPAHPGASPYGDSAADSYCHAWSCTPAWFLRRYFCPRGGVQNAEQMPGSAGPVKS